MSLENERSLINMQFNDQVAVVTLNNPPVNALSHAVIEQLSETFHNLEQISPAAVVITGQGSHSFSAGADIKELVKNNPERNQAYFSVIYDTLGRIAACPYPVIAAINGYAFGAGLELALCADIRVMDQNAQMSAAGVNLNLVFCTQRLLRLVGPGRARDMLFYARRVNAEEALEFGLVEHAAPPGTAGDLAGAIAAEISHKGQEAVRMVKQVLNMGIDLPLNQGLKLEAEALYRMLNTAEFKRRADLFLARK